MSHSKRPEYELCNLNLDLGFTIASTGTSDQLNIHTQRLYFSTYTLLHTSPNTSIV